MLPCPAQGQADVHHALCRVRSCDQQDGVLEPHPLPPGHYGIPARIHLVLKGLSHGKFVEGHPHVVGKFFLREEESSPTLRVREEGDSDHWP